MAFADIIGQLSTVTYLQNAVRTGNIAQAYILAGMPGTGKKTLAALFAQSLVCTAFDTGTGEPCGECIACRQATSGNHPDITHVTHEKVAISVDDIREQVVSDVQVKPYYGGKKIYIIDDAELMRPPAQNALLKTLEEPPDYAVFLLLTATEDALLPTIRSRSFLLRVNPLPPEALTKLTLEACGGDVQKAAFVGAYSRGSLGAALALAHDEESYNHASELVQLQMSYIGGVLSRRIDPNTEMRFMASLLSGRQCNADNMGLLKRLFRDILICKSNENAGSITFTSYRDEIASFAARLSYEGINHVLSLLDEAVRASRFNVNPDPLAAMVVDGIQEAKWQQ